MQIIYNLPHVFNGSSSSEENATVLNILLECLISINLAYLALNPSTPALYRSGVVYDRTLWWEAIPALYKRGYGDCKSLTAALIAEYRLAGISALPVFRFITNADGSNDYHILVQTISGFEDPSKILGMGDDENSRFYR